MERHSLSPFSGTPSIGCLSTTDPLQNPSIFPADFPHQYKQESTTQTATPSSPFPVFSLIFIPNSSQDSVVLSVCTAYRALLTPTPRRMASLKRCARTGCILLFGIRCSSLILPDLVHSTNTGGPIVCQAESPVLMELTL